MFTFFFIQYKIRLGLAQGQKRGSRKKAMHDLQNRTKQNLFIADVVQNQILCKLPMETPRMNHPTEIRNFQKHKEGPLPLKVSLFETLIASLPKDAPEKH